MTQPTCVRASTLNGLAIALTIQWWPQVVALVVACSIVATTIIGALAVGSSLQQSLRSLALARLGRIEAAVLGETFFTTGLVDDLRATTAQGGPKLLVAAIVIPVTVSTSRGEATSATLLACDDPAGLGFEPAPPPLMADSVLANTRLAEALGTAEGDAVVLRIARPTNVPPDSPLGRRTGESDGRRLTIGSILPSRGLGQFSLRPEQSTRPLAVTSLATAQRILRQEGIINAIFAIDMPEGMHAAEWLRSHVTPSLPDYGLAIEEASRDPASSRLTSTRLILSSEVDAAAAAVLGPLDGHPTLVMLANSLTVGDAESGQAMVPYSTVLGIDTASLPVGSLVDDSGQSIALPPDDGIVINRWLADDLAAQGKPVRIGDPITLALFEPETVHGRVVETSATFAVTGIAAMKGAAACRGVVPEVEGITDEASIADWDPPFPFDASRVRSTPPNDQDDRYWKEFGPTPKAFVSLATARRLAGSRFGQTTAWLLPTPSPSDMAGIEAAVARRMRPESAGIRIRSLVDDALRASEGSTPFGVLFLALSTFVVAAGLLLEWLLFSLLVAAHRRDLGILAAVGWPPRLMTRILITIGGGTAACGTTLGAVIGPWWAGGLLWWLGMRWTADVDPGAAGVFATNRPELSAIAVGTAAALVVSLMALAMAARRASRQQPLALLRETDRSLGTAKRQRPWIAITIAASALIAAVGSAIQGRTATAQSAIGFFFASGALALPGSLAIFRVWLSARRPSFPSRTLLGLARRNLAFATGRALSVATIVAVATFLVVAVSSFAQRIPDDLSNRQGPTGGWTDIVMFASATGVDPSDAEDRTALGLTLDQDSLIAACTITRLRSSEGDDGACTNLYATLKPTVLGVDPSFVERGGFQFVSHAPLAPEAAGNPWLLLDGSRKPGSPIPVILDQATAQWGLKLGGVGSRFTIDDDAGRPVAMEIVGLLAPCVLQGYVIVSENDFQTSFPDRSGYGMALIDASGARADARIHLPQAVAAAWADAGPTIITTARRLASLQAVQNTFLSGFQALGGFGILLGTVGVAAVQAQGTLERIGVLSVLRAVGFTLARVRLLLVLETVAMVGIGLAVGSASACLAVAPALVGGAARIPLAWMASITGGALAAAVIAAVATASRQTIPVRPRAD